jgi:hypothetical protein
VLARHHYYHEQYDEPQRRSWSLGSSVMAVAELQGEVLPKIFVTRQMDSSLGSPVLGALRSREEETRDLSCVLNVSSKILCCAIPYTHKKI